MQSVVLPAVMTLCVMVGQRVEPRLVQDGTLANLPEAPGSDAVRTACVTCHSSDIISGQRLSRDAWEREADKMISWGAKVAATERGLIIEYLSTQFGRSAPARAGSQDAAVALMPRCLTCHDLGLIEQQRLTEAGWVREIDKMIAWGATLTESERDLFAAYLARRFPFSAAPAGRPDLSSDSRPPSRAASAPALTDGVSPFPSSARSVRSSPNERTAQVLSTGGQMCTP
jgi:cytochrome c553